MLKRMLSFF